MPRLHSSAMINMSQYSDAGAEGSFGEFDMWCSDGGMGWHCPSNMRCDLQVGNPHFGIVSFDNFFSTFLLMFQA